jgi:hypothetical protein
MRDTIEMAREAGDDWDSTLSTDKEFLKRLVALARADERSIEREACAKEAGEFAKKWWSIHCASNKHMETTRKAHDDFCALQAKIRARGTSTQTGENP